MKKLLCAVLVCVLVFTQSASGFALNISEGTQRLSEMSDEECVAFVKSYNITIPDDYEELEWADFIRKTIVSVENDPDYFFVYSYTETLRFANEIKNAVNDYYGVPTTFNIMAPTSMSEYTLQYSEEYWDENPYYVEYNCYAYALEINDNFYSPGDFTNDYAYVAGDSVDRVAIGVQADLRALGYSCVSVTTVCPMYSSVRLGQTAIAVRVCDVDFHFMRLVSVGWVHKPSDTRPLRYLYAADAMPFWSNEYIRGGVAYPETHRYDSNVYFLLYANNHDYVYTTTGNHYHSGIRHFYEYADVCADCHDTKNNTWVSKICDGPPCVVQLGNPPILSIY